MTPELSGILRAIGSGGGGILAVVLAVYLAIKVVALVRPLIAHRNVNPGAHSEELRLICPIATGRRTLDDLHDVLVAIVGGIDKLNDKQDDHSTAVGTLTSAITNLRVEMAKRNGSRGA